MGCDLRCCDVGAGGGQGVGEGSGAGGGSRGSSAMGTVVSTRGAKIQAGPSGSSIWSQSPVWLRPSRGADSFW